MRHLDKVILAIALVAPVLLATLGWPKFVEWLTAPAPQATPETVVAGATAVADNMPAVATPVANSAAASTPTVPSVQPAARQQPTRTLPTVAPRVVDDPVRALSTFYALVSARDFDAAEQLWSPNMRSAFPPHDNIVRRFGETQAIGLQHAEVLAQSESQATVSVDVLETDASGRTRQFVGQWHLVRGPDGWLLDRPELRPVP